MARTFIQEILNQSITSTAVYSSGQLYEMLGRPNLLAVQIIIDATSTASTFTVELQHSNDGSDNTFSLMTGTNATTASLSAPDKFWIAATTVTPGAFIRLKISCASGTAQVRAIAVGRDN